MATSTALKTTNQYIKYTISITENSQDIANNKTNVTVSVRFYRTNTGYTTYGSGTIYCKINGTQYSKALDTSHKITNSGIVLFTKTLDITHDNTGYKKLTCSAWIDHSQVDSDEQSYSQVLTTIPRAAEVTAASDFNDETYSPAITFKNPGKFTVHPYLKFWSTDPNKPLYTLTRYNDTISTTATSYTWTITENEMIAIRNSMQTQTTCKVRAGLRTTMSDGSYEWRSVDKTFSIVNANPGFGVRMDVSNSTSLKKGGTYEFKRGTIKFWLTVSHISGLATNAVQFEFHYKTPYQSNFAQILTSGTATKIYGDGPASITYSDLEYDGPATFDIQCSDTYVYNLTKTWEDRKYLLEGLSEMYVIPPRFTASKGATLNSFTIHTGFRKTIPYTWQANGGLITMDRQYLTLGDKVSFIVTDNRGNETSYDITPEILPYFNPEVSRIAISRSTSGTVDVTIDAKYAPVELRDENLNSMKVTVCIGEIGESYYFYEETFAGLTNNKLTVSCAPTTTDGSGETVSRLEDAKEYNIRIDVYDAFGIEAISYDTTVSTAERPININTKGVAVGGIIEDGENDGRFKCNWNAYFNDAHVRLIDDEGNVNDPKMLDIRRYKHTNLPKMTYQEVRSQTFVDQSGDVVFRRRTSTDGNTWATNGQIKLTDDGIEFDKIDKITATSGWFTSTRDVDPNNPLPDDAALVVGNKDGAHLEFDSNEIVVKKDSTNPGDLGISGKSVALYVDATKTFSTGEDDTSHYIASKVTYDRTYNYSPNGYITQAGVFGRGTSSSERYKKDIKDVEDKYLNPYNILNIPVRQYQYREGYIPVNQHPDDIYIGFIAEEVEEAYPIAAEYNEDGSVEMWNIKMLFPALLKIVQDQQKTIEELQVEINNLKQS